MAKDDAVEPEVFTNEDDFMREIEGYTAITEDEGYQIEFPEKGGTFKGTYTGVKTLPVKDVEAAAAKGEPTTWQMLTFIDEKSERCNIPSNYRLDEALSRGMKSGQEVMIVHHGMKDLGNGHTLNRMSVYAKG